MIKQASGVWDAKDANMASYRFFVQQFTSHFEGCEFHHVPWINNEVNVEVLWRLTVMNTVVVL